MYMAVRRNSELVILNVATLWCYNPQLFASSNKFHHFWTLKSSGLTITKMSTCPILRLNQSYTKHCHLGQTSHWRWQPSGKEEWPLLVVAPSSLRFVWRDQVWESVEFVDVPIPAPLKGSHWHGRSGEVDFLSPQSKAPTRSSFFFKTTS